jgi:hypothetical protein
VLEDGYPLLERAVRAMVPDRVEVRDRETGDVPVEGELGPDVVRTLLGLEPKRGPGPSTLCQGRRRREGR